MKTWHRAIILVAILFVIVAAILSIQPTSTPQVMADCWRTIHLLAWEDKNGDGIQNNNEPPIKGIGYKIDGIFAELLTDPKKLSDEEGKIEISLWSPGNCVQSKYTLQIIDFGTRRTTTENPITFILSPTEFSFSARFGVQE